MDLSAASGHREAACVAAAAHAGAPDGADAGRAAAAVAGAVGAARCAQWRLRRHAWRIEAVAAVIHAR